MHVLVVHNRYRSGLPSGENQVVDTEVAALRALGHRVTAYQRSSDEIAAMAGRLRAGLPLRPLWSPEDAAAVARIVERDRPDVVHLHNPYPLISPAVLRVAARAGVPAVQTVHNFRHVCVNGTFFRDGRACHDCLDRALPLPAVRHGCYRGSRAQSLALGAALVAHRPTFRGLDRFVALTETVAAHLRRYGIPAERIAVKPNTVADPGRPTDSGEGFLYVGRLSPEKGIGLLLDAWQTHPVGALGTLTVVGDGPERPRVDAAAGTRPDIVVAGQLPAAATQAAIRRSAVVVVPSTWAEAFPRVIVEALAHGRPVLSTDLGSLPDIVGPAGWAVPPTSTALAGALARAASSDLAGLGRVARSRFDERFSPAVVHGRLVEIYREAVGRAGRPA